MKWNKFSWRESDAVEKIEFGSDWTWEVPLPEIGERVLVSDGVKIWLDTWIENHDGLSLKNGNAKGLYWMSLPKLPKGSSIKGHDSVNHPNHYQGKHGLEVISVIDNFIGDLSGKAAWSWGNMIKYVLRFQKKNGLEDLKKARKNLDWLIEEMEDGREKMNQIQKLDKILDWQVANYPLRMSEKVRLMSLVSEEFEKELDRMAAEYHQERYRGGK